MRHAILLFVTFISLQAGAKGVNFERIAEGMSQSLIHHFWGASFPGHEQRYFFNYGSDLTDMTTENYWPEAHAIDVVTDAYLRSGDTHYRNLYPLWWDGMPRYHDTKSHTDGWWAAYVDDMEWIALALVRMYETSGEKQYLEKARQLYDDWIWPTWGPDDETPWYGGITWNTEVKKTKNACSNAPAAILAAKLYINYPSEGYTHGKERDAYLKESKRIYEWLRNHLLDAETGCVYDNMNGQGKVNRTCFSYNSGTTLGAADILYHITGEKAYLNDAVKVADYVLREMSGNGGVPKDDVHGDGALFHGIFFRYFAILAKNHDLDKATRKRYRAYLTHCATVLANEGLNHRTMLYGGRWHQAPTDDEPVCLNAHLTGCMLMEAVCTLR